MTRQRFQRLFDIIEWQWRCRAVRQLIIVVRARLFAHGSSWESIPGLGECEAPGQDRAEQVASLLVASLLLYYRPTEK